jgi:hypothetical protein
MTNAGRSPATAAAAAVVDVQATLQEALYMLHMVNGSNMALPAGLIDGLLRTGWHCKTLLVGCGCCCGLKGGSRVGRLMCISLMLSLTEGSRYKREWICGELGYMAGARKCSTSTAGACP